VSILSPPINPFVPKAQGQAQLIVAPEVTQVEGVPVPAKMRAVRITQAQQAQVRWTMTDPDGNPVDFSDIPGATVSFWFHESLSMAPGQGINLLIPGTVIDATQGTVQGDFENAAATAGPGIYIVDVGVLDNKQSLVFSNRFYLIIENSQFAAGGQSNLGPLTVAELRLSLRDVDRGGNLWLASFEWDLSEIAFCITRPIGEFNEAPPPLTQQYNTTTFPFKWNWLKASQGYLLQIAALWYMRVHLPYQAGGLSIDDKNKADVYWRTSQQLLQEWKQWVQFKKVQMNAEGAYMSMGSSYSNLGWY
jgi:hypothetical protein